MKSKKDNGVFETIRMAAMSHHLLTAGTILCVAASVVASLLPPLLLAGILEFLLYYMTKPEYQLRVREEIYLDNMLDLF